MRFRFDGDRWPTSFGVLFGLTLFLAAIVLVIKGVENVGQHLR